MDKRVLDGRSLGASAPRFWSRRRVDRVRERGSGRESGRAGWGRGGRERGRMRGIVWVLLCAACSGANGQQVRPLPPPSFPLVLPLIISVAPAGRLRVCGRFRLVDHDRAWLLQTRLKHTARRDRWLPGTHSLSRARSLARSLGSCLTQRLLGARRVAGTPTAR